MPKDKELTKKINVLSLFNGMSTGHTALSNVGIEVNKYYSSEIKPAAIKLTQHHYPGTIQLGDVTKWKDWDIDYKSIDMVLSGSPCQDLSIAGKRAGLEGERSSLFWVFVDILNHIKELNPNVLFLQENVGSAPKSDVGIMSRALGVYPVRINSSLVTAQLRDRYYWTNIKTKPDGLFGDMVTDIPQPKDRKIMFKDIVVNGAVKKEKSGALLQGCWKMFIKDENKQNKYLKKVVKQGYQTPPLVYVNKDKHSCLSTTSGRNLSQDSLIKRNEATGMITLIEENSIIRTVNKVEMCRLQGFPDDWCDILTKNQAGSLLGDGWTLPIIEHIFSFINKKQKI
tara:strand:- start:8956 stop:9975 length:1020 start_codon:yes stop_codon:yes gene_type:complete